MIVVGLAIGSQGLAAGIDLRVFVDHCLDLRSRGVCGEALVITPRGNNWGGTPMGTPMRTPMRI